MKKTTRIVSLALVFVLLFSFAVFAEKGDLNSDGNVDDNDLQVLIDHIAEGGGYLSIYDIRSDAECVINILDAIMLKKIINGYAGVVDDNWTAHWY